MVILLWMFFWLLWRVLSLRGFEWREAFLAAFVIAGASITLSTEVLTLAAGVRFWPLVIFWTAMCAALLFYLFRIKNAWEFKFAVAPFDLLEKVLLAGCGLVLAVVGFIALYAPPNTWDSMTYHMARVGHWVQNGGVMNYPTNEIRQLVYPPYAEYAILHAQILSFSDRFANLVQWTALLGSAIGASLVTQILGGGRSVQIAAALLVLTIPMAILQGSSTQNDLVVSLWAISAAVFTLRFMQTALRRWVLLAAMAFSLAVLTKLGGLVFAAPFIMLALFTRTIPLARKFLLAGAILTVLVVFVGPFYGRLTQIGPDPFKVMSIAPLTVEGIGPRETLSNVLRGTATELALPWHGWNAAVVGLVESLHRMMGMSTADERTTFAGPFNVGNSLDEDYAPNPMHMLLFIAAAVMFWFVRGKGAPELGYLLAVLAGGFLFSASMKWQPWISRLHLPFFVLAMPLTVLVLDRVLHRKIALLLLIAFLMAIQPLISNNTRRLVSAKTMLRLPREQIYFAKHPWEYSVVMKVSAALKKMQCAQLGLTIGGDAWEYPWIMAMGPGSRVEYLDVTGPASRFSYPLGAFVPCAVVAEKSGEPKGQRVFLGRPFVKVGSSGTMDFFIRAQEAR